jgi:3-isopropylmalate/(R)-2-methylmalate dehydratase large subunit
MSNPPTKPRTIIEKIWDNHVVVERPDAPSLLYIDLHLVHEVTSPQAFDGLRARGLKVRRPDLTIATTDHSTPTTPRGFPIVDKIAATQVEKRILASTVIHWEATSKGLYT